MTSTFTYECLDSVDSTNSHLKRHPELWSQNFYTLRALNQTQGRGRHGRTWFSGKNNLTFSFVYNSFNSSDIVDISPLTIYAGLALRNALSSISNSRILLKWPNDVTYSGKKLGGILTEMAQKNESTVIIFGIGVNLNSDLIPSELADKITSLKDITNHDLNAEMVLNKIMNEMQTYLPNYKLPLSQTIRDEFATHFDKNANIITLFDQTTKTINKKKFDIVGINENGLLSVIDENGNPDYINAGELEFTAHSSIKQ